MLLLDGHLMSRVNHGYANTYGTTTVPAAAPGPRDYTHDTLFPAVRDMVRRDFGLEVFTHALFGARTRGRRRSGATTRAAWTVEAKFIVNDYGLRNRLAIITETPGQPTFERRIYAQYAYIMALLEYTNAHAKEMQAVVKSGRRRDGRRTCRPSAESGQLRNWLDGEYQSRGKIDLLAYRTNVAGVPAGHELPRDTSPARRPGRRRSCTASTTSRCRSARATPSVPRGYLLPADLADIAAKLRAHNIRVHDARQADARSRARQFTIEQMRKVRSGGYDMTVLDGAFSPLEDARVPGRQRSTWTWRSRWRTPRSTTSSRRRATASSAGACSTTSCARLAPTRAPRSIRSSKCGVK